MRDATSSFTLPKEISKKGLKRSLIKPSMLPINMKTQQKDIDQVRIVSKKGVEGSVVPPVELLWRNKQEKRRAINHSISWNYRSVTLHVD
jgi:hypothetical protein